MKTLRGVLVLFGAAAAAILLGACGGSDSADAAATREVLVDYVHDEVASSFMMYFPRNVTVRPGDTVRFRQEWTGEPHTVTAGRMADEMMGTLVPLFEEYADLPEDQVPEEAMGTFMQFIETIPWMLDDFEAGVNQNAAQPCFRREGGPPEDKKSPCPDEEQVQPAFDGRFDYYNSGFIPYEGESGNVFEVPIAEDTEPGTYYYYCNVHGPFQFGSITVAEPGAEIPSQEDVSRQAREEIETAAAPLLAAFEEAAGDAQEAQIYGVTVRKPYSGWGVETTTPDSNAFISEFIPRELHVQADEPVTWSFVGGHTVSFDVPEYFAEIHVSDDGTVEFNPDAVFPVDAPPVPTPDPGGPPEGDPPAIDAGAWDGEGFISSGVIGGGTWTLTFTEPGTYQYACLIHPQMIGTVVVE